MTNARIERLMTADRPWVADGGLETTLIFHDGIDLPHFASCLLFDSESESGVKALERYFQSYIDLARTAGTGFVLDTATWRSGAFWADTLGRTEAGMERLTRASTAFAVGLRDAHETATLPILVNGVVGPAGDGYAPDRMHTPEAAAAIHAPQIRWMAEEGADLVSAMTMTHTGEAIGIAEATRAAGLPVVISFTVETDGRLVSGPTLAEAIATTEDATGGYPLFYMVNCAHPDHFTDALSGDWTARIGGVRANASRMSHAELDAATELDDGNPEEFGTLYAGFRDSLPALRVIGGCCGSDERHIGCAARHLVPRHRDHAPAS